MMTPIRPANWKTLPGESDITRVELPNGITILTRSNFNSPSVVINGYLACGSVFDPIEKLGLAHFSSLALLRGTQKRNFQQIYDTMESLGVSLGFGASVHNTSFAGRALAEDFSTLMDLLSESLREPVFPPEHVERLRAQMLTGLAIRAQDTAEMASLGFDQVVFKGHPYANPEDGYPETIQVITRNDLVEFHQTHYGPRGMVIVVVGAVTPEEAVTQVRRCLGDWTNARQAEAPGLPKIIPLEKPFRHHIVIAGKSQTDLVMGTLGPKRCSPDYLAASLGNNILGQFGMMGRIGDVVRVQAGLAYDASTSLNAWIDGGSWEVSAGVNPANLNRAIDLIVAELRRYIKEPVSLEELQDSQANFIGRLPLSLESNAGVANALLNLERFQLGLDYYRQYPARVEQVTVSDVLEVSRRYLNPDQLATISAGPQI
jgi:zinc protease